MNSPSCQTTSQIRGVAMFFFLSSFENIVFFSLRSISGTSSEESLNSSRTETVSCKPILQEDRFLSEGWGGAYQSVVENIARYSKPTFLGKATLSHVVP